MKDREKLLKSDRTEVRRQAVEDLQDCADESCIPLLLDAMKDQSWRVRKTATSILQNQFAVDQYVDGLIGLLYIDDNAGARNSAIDLLISLGRIAIPHLLDAFETDNHDVRKFVIDVIGEISDKRALPLLLNALKDEDENVKASAVEHLGKLKEPSVVEALIDILKSEDIWLAYPAADALGRICDPKAVPVLVEALENKTLREPVLRALSCFSDPDTLDSMLPLLITGTRSVKEEVLKAVNEFYKRGVDEEIISGKTQKHLGNEALDILLKFAWSSKPDIRLSAILLLGLLKDKRAVQPLLDMSSEEEFRDEIKRALVYIGRDIPDYLIGLFDGLNTFQKRFVTEIAVEIERPEFFDLFEEFIEDDDGHVRALAAKGLARIGDTRIVSKLFQLLNDSYIDVQEAAVEALVRLRGGLDVHSLMEMLSDKNSYIRKNIAYLLGKIHAVEAISSIGFVVKDPDVSVRLAAVSALDMLNDEQSIKHLMITLTDEVPEIRIAAAYALGAYTNEEARNALVLLLADSDEAVRVAAVKALAIHPDKRVVDVLIPVLSDDNGFVVTAALETLAAVGSEKARDAIVSLLSSTDDEIKRTAISSLAPFDGMDEKIKPFLADADWATRKIAVEVLGKKADADMIHLLESVFDDEADVTVRKTIEEVISVHK